MYGLVRFSPPELGHGTVAGGSVIARLSDVRTRSAHLPDWLPVVVGSTSSLYWIVVFRRWFGLSRLISASPAASPLVLMFAWAIFAVATQEPEGTCCRRVWAVPWPSYRSPRSTGIVRWPLPTVGSLPV